MPALTPSLLNVSFIVFAVWLAPYFDPPVMALAWAVFCGGAMQLAFQLPFLLKIRMLPPVNTTDEELEAAFTMLEKSLARVAEERGLSC